MKGGGGGAAKKIASQRGGGGVGGNKRCRAFLPGPPSSVFDERPICINAGLHNP